MAYYNRNNKKLHINENAFKYLNCGECAKIKHNDNMILKEYFSNTMLNCRLTPQLFDILKTINNPHFIELYDLYTDYSFIELLKSKLSLQTFYPDAYTAKYYKENTTDPLCEPIDYLLDNFNELEHLFEIFTTNEIITSDVKRKMLFLVLIKLSS